MDVILECEGQDDALVAVPCGTAAGLLTAVREHLGLDEAAFGGCDVVWGEGGAALAAEDGGLHELGMGPDERVRVQRAEWYLAREALEAEYGVATWMWERGPDVLARLVTEGHWQGMALWWLGRRPGAPAWRLEPGGEFHRAVLAGAADPVRFVDFVAHFLPVYVQMQPGVAVPGAADFGSSTWLYARAFKLARSNTGDQAWLGEVMERMLDAGLTANPDQVDLLSEVVKLYMTRGAEGALSLRMVERLHARGAALERGNAGAPPLFIVCEEVASRRRGREDRAVDCIGALLRVGAHPRSGRFQETRTGCTVFRPLSRIFIPRPGRFTPTAWSLRLLDVILPLLRAGADLMDPTPRRGGTVAHLMLLVWAECPDDARGAFAEAAFGAITAGVSSGSRRAFAAAQDKKGNTALHCAAHLRPRARLSDADTRLLQLFESARHVRNNKQLTACDVACICGQNAVAALLSRHIR
eukprot:TRINITY_DN18476_c0_g1_i1.p1 TRINITY_DN18476_c0_g1~~TRINITY_DN18476_c0_g1_i1.p1  ORF type:complete len:470 (+),score=57.17 TRINITY_DN18476_c0_g1_i1:72-1481(+)